MLECLNASFANTTERLDNIVGTGKYYSLDDILEIWNRRNSRAIISWSHGPDVISVINSQFLRHVGDDLTQMKFLGNRDLR